jgi:TATA-binding protein-associated factor
MRSGADPMSSPVPVGGATTTGREELPIVTVERDPQESSLIADSADCTSQNTTSSSPKAEPVTKTNAPPSSSTKLNDEVTMDYSRSIWTTIMQYLVAQLRSGEWEARHGSSLALRDLVRLHGESYGMHDNCTDSQNKRLHETALGSVAAVILEMLAQDRFGDFVGDQVVAPVREAGSQALASLMRHLDLRSVADIHSVLLHMILQEWISRKSAAGSINSPAIKHIWELRHAGLMGLKYELAVRPDLISGEVPGMNGDESKVYMDGVLQSSLLG